VNGLSFPNSFTLPTEREFALLSWLWEHGPASSRDLHIAFGQVWGVRRQVIRSMVHIMLEKGLLEQQHKGPQVFYRPALSRSEFEQVCIGQIATLLFQGSLPALLLAVSRHPQFGSKSPETPSKVARILS
jgi:predicted transcriptional regulator